ncbi:HNH endonuclease [Burkholderia cenocepacia]|uniref:winged helix-turn-helix domain-containing protein n=1 Tax=Burkholderia cenocepacia TaxID=95486 RepID=UPI001CF21975|nr:winged helix-turn-helix domain-containing protein [Burkholderia cenocepacia]MCA7927389.1 HNH endonuclease [Burkholderia cenocepacia]
MPYPSRDELELSLLKLIFDHGEEYEMRAVDTYGPLADYFGLSELERTQTRQAVLADERAEPYWNNMVQWARRRLNERDYLAPARRGRWRLSKTGVDKARLLESGRLRYISYPDEVSENLIEGAVQKVTVNAYERSILGRQACINHYGYRCFVCEFDFEKIYGERGKNFIHVHHLVPLASIGESYLLDPIRDLRPVCPNCHSMIHRTDPPCSLEILKSMLVLTT